MNCYLCGTRDLVQLTTQLRNGPGTVLYCDTCGIGMLRDRPDDLKKYYEKDYRKRHGPRFNQPSSYDEIFQSYVHYQTQRMELLWRLLNKNIRLLEVGCSTGYFLYNIKDMVGEAVGVDYDPGAAEFAGRICQCSTFGGHLEETGLALASFDVICTMQTMEHVKDPIGFVDMMSKYLKPDGVIYIEVPNLNDPMLSIYNNLNYRNFYFHEAHLFYFTPRSLTTVMNRAGFKGKVCFMQDYNFLNHLHWILVGKPQPICHNGLGTSKLHIASNVKKKLYKELEIWIERVDKQYKAILTKYHVTENIGFIGGLIR